jgi:hypothetical protein
MRTILHALIGCTFTLAFLTRCYIPTATAEGGPDAGSSMPGPSDGDGGTTGPGGVTGATGPTGPSGPGFQPVLLTGACDKSYLIDGASPDFFAVFTGLPQTVQTLSASICSTPAAVFAHNAPSGSMMPSWWPDGGTLCESATTFQTPGTVIVQCGVGQQNDVAYSLNGAPVTAQLILLVPVGG